MLFNSFKLKVFYNCIIICSKNWKKLTFNIYSVLNYFPRGKIKVQIPKNLNFMKKHQYNVTENII